MDFDLIKNKIENIFTHTGCTISKCEISMDGRIIWCSIDTPDSRFMIGRDGETLRSLNYLVRKMVEKVIPEEETSNIFIDVNGYHKKRFDNLKSIAHMMAERARYFKSNISVDPMPAQDRRIIHMFLEGEKDIKTESEGTGPERRVIIKYTEEVKL